MECTMKDIKDMKRISSEEMLKDFDKFLDELTESNEPVLIDDNLVCMPAKLYEEVYQIDLKKVVEDHSDEFKD